MKRELFTAAAIAATLVTGCVSVEDAPIFVPGETTMYTTEADNTTGVLGAFGKNYTVTVNQISKDAVTIVQNNEIYVLERGESNVMKVSPAGLIQYQKHIIDKFNPHDLIVVNSLKGYICSNNIDSIAVFNPTTGDVNSYISIAAYGKTGVLTNATKMELIGSNLYVACQMGYGTSEGSLILKIDTNTDTVVDTIRCSFKNVSDMDRYNNTLVVTSPGDWGVIDDGGVEEINLTTKAVRTLVAGTKLGIDITTLAIDEKRGEFYGSIYRKWGDSPMIRYSNDFTPIDTIDGVVQSYAAAFDQAKGKLYFTEYSIENVPGIIIYDASTAKTEKVPTKLIPRSLAFITSMIQSN